MRMPMRLKAAPRAPTSQELSYPAPVGGWNARDALADMAPTDAIILNNFMPRTNYVEIRGGYSSYASGTTGNVKTLATYNSLTGVNTMYGYTSTGIYEVTSSGAVGASKLARTNGKHQWAMFGDGTSNWLIACNGVDKPAYFDGTTWTAVDAVSAPALTGVTTTKLIAPVVYKGRLFFIEVSSMNIWYLAAGAAGGILTKIDFSAECSKGGFMMAAGNWTRDAGDGEDDVFVAVTSEGQAVVYKGNNPAVAANWAKIGTYFVGKPLGRRCLTQFGSDMLLLTESGVFPLAAALQTAKVDARYALSYKIESAFRDAARTYGTTFGWEMMLHERQSALIVNIPLAEDGTHYQYVMNTVTKAWCKFTMWSAETFGLLSGELYFAIGTTTQKAWTGQIDGANNIEAYGKGAFNYLGSRNRLKKVKLYRPVLSVNGPLSFLSDIDIDFEDHDITGTATYSSTAASLWGTALWGTGLWSGGQLVVKQWTSPAEWQGYCVSPKVKIVTNSVTVQWLSNDVIFEGGAIF